MSYATGAENGANKFAFAEEVRLLLCIPTMSGGGAERQLTYLASELVRRGVEVHVALRRGGVNLERLQNSGAQIHFLHSRHSFSPLALIELFRLFKRTGVHLVQTYLTQMDVLGGLSAKLGGVPWILTERSSGSAYSFKRSARRRIGSVLDKLRVQVGRHANAVAANSKGGADYWQSRGVALHRLNIIPNGISLDPSAAPDPESFKQIGLLPSERFILSAGRFDDGKNPRILNEAFRSISRQFAVRGVICGKGPLLGQMREEALQMSSVERVIFPGYIQDLSALMNSASVYVSSSRFEGCPNVVLEAMAAKCPLVVSDIPAHREILDENSAVFVDAEQSSEIARGITEVLSDPARTAKRVESARKRVELMSLPAMGERYLDLYASVLSGLRRANPRKFELSQTEVQVSS